MKHNLLTHKDFKQKRFNITTTKEYKEEIVCDTFV